MLKPVAHSIPLLPFNLNDAVIIPIEARAGSGSYSQINLFVAKHDTEKFGDVSGHLQAALESVEGMASVDVTSPRLLILSVAQQRKNAHYFILALGMITLCSGGLSIMNIMLASVTSRRQEIGLRLAIGANKKDIFGLFLTEALLLSLTGALLGALLGVAVAWSVAMFSGWQFQLSVLALILGAGSALMMGILFGIWPALNAARLQPVEALREN